MVPGLYVQVCMYVTYTHTHTHTVYIHIYIYTGSSQLLAGSVIGDPVLRCLSSHENWQFWAIFSAENHQFLFNGANNRVLMPMHT